MRLGSGCIYIKLNNKTWRRIVIFYISIHLCLFTFLIIIFKSFTNGNSRSGRKNLTVKGTVKEN